MVGWAQSGDSDMHTDDLGLSPGGSDLCHSVGPNTPDFKQKRKPRFTGLKTKRNNKTKQKTHQLFL